jgi:hypothetical protein
MPNSCPISVAERGQTTANEARLLDYDDRKILSRPTPCSLSRELQIDHSGVDTRHHIRRPNAALGAAADRVSARIAAALDGQQDAKVTLDPAVGGFEFNENHRIVLSHYAGVAENHTGLYYA